MTRVQSLCLVLAIAVAPLLSSCSVNTLPNAATLLDAAPAAGAVPLKKATLTGTWTGQWDTGTSSGTFSMHLTQKGKKFSGPVSILIKGTKINGTIKGTIAKGGKLSLTVNAQPLGNGHGTGTVNKTRTSMNGSVTFKSESSTFKGTKK